MQFVSLIHRGEASALGKENVFKVESWRTGFSRRHVQMWELDRKDAWALKNWCFWTVVLKKTLENPFYSKEIIQVDPKGNQSWIFIGRTDAEAEAPVLWPPDVKNWLIGKDPNAGKDWRQEEKGAAEDEMAEDGITNSIDMSLSKLREIVKDRGGLHAAVHGVTESQAWLSKWITATNEGTSRSRWAWGRQKEMMHASKIKLGR